MIAPDQVILNRFRGRSRPLVLEFLKNGGPIGGTDGSIGPPVHYLKKGLIYAMTNTQCIRIYPGKLKFYQIQDVYMANMP